ncbi:hypothetical protein TNCV_404821 [Trichonephila clavipes]|nr:hypothetical protein TNCV_404821 [Trichonephila clavipes]
MRAFEVPPCHEDTIHLQTSKSSPGFEPIHNETAVPMKFDLQIHLAMYSKSCEDPARIGSQSSRHCWRSPLPHASALNQRDFGCVLGVQQTKQLSHVAKVDLPAREAIQSGDSRRTFGQCIRRVVTHYPVEIWLWPIPEDKEGQLAPTPRRCSTGSLKYRKCVLEE